MDRHRATYLPTRSASVRFSRRGAAPRGCVGASRLDLVAALVVLVVLAAVLGLGDEGSEAHSLALVENQVRASALRAKTLARATRSPHGVIFDSVADRLGVVDATGELVLDSTTDAPLVIDARAAGNGVVDLVSASFDDGGKAAVWDPSGVALIGGRVTLSCGGLQRVLVLDAASGKFITTP